LQANWVITNFFFGDSPSSVDASLFAHLTCNLNAPMVDSPLSEIISKYNVLVEYHQRVLLHLTESTIHFDKTNAPPPSVFSGFANNNKANTPPKEKTEEEKKAEQNSWYFAGGAIGLMLAYVVSQHVLVQVGDEIEDDDE